MMAIKYPTVASHRHEELPEAGDPITAHVHAGEDITTGTLDGDRLSAISTTKKGGVPAVTPGSPSEYLRDTGDFEIIQQNEVQSLHDDNITVFDTVDLTELSDTYVPYQDDNKPGLVDSNITIDKLNGRVGINVVAPQAIIDSAGVGTEDLQKVVDSNDNPRHMKNFRGETTWNVADGSGEVGKMEFKTFEGYPCFSIWIVSGT